MGKSTCCPKPQQCYDAYSNIYASSKHTTCWIANPLLCYHGSVCYTMVTLLVRKQNVVWKGCTRLPSSDKSKVCTPATILVDLCKLRSKSATIFPRLFLKFDLCTFVSFGFRVRDEEEISPDSVICVGYHVGYAYCGICELYKRVLWL